MRMDDELLGRQSAFQEAKALYRMLGDENAVEELHELIAVPPKIEMSDNPKAQGRKPLPHVTIC